MSATAETSATGRVVDYVLGVKASDLPATVRKEGLRSFFNVLGCTVGGAKHAAVDATWAALKPFAGAPQATLMATLTRGILSFNLDWQYIMVGIFIAVTMELCNIKALAFAIGLYLPLSTTLPIFVGGAVKGIIDWRKKESNNNKHIWIQTRGNYCSFCQLSHLTNRSFFFNF